MLIDDPIHLLKHLANNLLDQDVITAALSRRRHEIQLVDKEDSRRYGPRLREDVAHVAGRMADVQPFEVGNGCLDEPQ